jgi:hypothetical protein
MSTAFLRGRIASIVVCALIANPGLVCARPCGRVSLDRALSEASLIVTGSLLSTIHASIPGGDSKSMIRIDRVLKGEMQLSLVEVRHFLCGMDYDYVFQEGRRFIAFIDPYGSLVGGTAVFPASSQSAPKQGNTRGAVRAELRLALGDTDTRIARTALGALGELDGRAAGPVLERYRTAADFGIRFRALSLLTRFGDADALDEVARIVSAAPFTREFPHSWFYNEKEEPLMTAYDDLRGALRSYRAQSLDGSTVPDHVTERFVDGLGRLAQVNNRMIRREAIHALRGLNRRVSFPILAAALDDPDEHVRYDSMFTLCMAMEAPDLRCPATFLFEKDEEKYIKRVRMWWSTQKP